MLNSFKLPHSLGPILHEITGVSGLASGHPSITWALITSGRSHLSLTTRTWKEDKKPELYIDHMLKDFDGRGVKQQEGSIKSETAFKLFNLDEKLMINEGKLKREMINLQKIIHPDKHIKAGRETLEKSERLASLVNDSYELLKHPYKRAKYLLRLKWNKSQDEIESILDKLQLEPDFLSNMMDLREMIENSNSLENLTRTASQIEYDLDELMAAIDRDLKAKKFESALQKIGKLKFVANCHVTLQAKLGRFSNF